MAETTGRVHPLAPMDGLFRWLTVVVLLLPVVFLAHWLLRPVAAFLVLVYGSVWCWRPRRFLASPGRLVACFPLRTKVFEDIVGVEPVTRAEMTRRYGTQLRVGAGGLWGGFGYLWSRKGWVEFYISRLDRWVLIERRAALPLLISPVDPEALVADLQRG